MSKITFPKGFIWGTATASYQIEGAVKEDGRGISIWDGFSHTPGKVLDGHMGDIACDHYHLYKEDVQMMSDIGLNGYRFSIAWPRIFPEGKGMINQKGVDFYNALVDELLEKGIEPMVTLYHWDLPQALQDIGGWDNRETIEYYSDYAAYMFDVLGDRVKKWITHNEPQVVAFVGNATGEHAPGYQDYGLAVRISHHLMLSHAKAINIYRQSRNNDGIIGIALNLYPTYPATDSEDDMKAALLADGYHNRWFLDPVFKGLYPKDMLERYLDKLNAPVIKAGDMDLIKENSIDFLGVNFYTRAVAKKPKNDNILGFETILPQESRYTERQWEIYPQGLYDLLARIDKDYGNPRIFITENGAAFKDDKIIDGRIDDDDRLNYLKEHFKVAHKLIEDGVRLEGYYVWSLMDNFEWAFGPHSRFGIVYINYETMERTWKKSAYWYQDVIKNNGF